MVAVANKSKKSKADELEMLPDPEAVEMATEIEEVKPEEALPDGEAKPEEPVKPLSQIEREHLEEIQAL